MRNTQLVAAIAAMAFISAAAAARSQSDTSLKLTTKASAAAAEFRAGVSDYQNLSFESAAAHFKAAIDAYTAAVAATLYGGKSATVERDKRRAEVIIMLRLLGHYVEGACKNDMSTFLSSGFLPASTAHQTPQPLSPPSAIRIDQGGKLAMTHYCMMHNQPMMELKAADSVDAELEAMKAALKARGK